MRLNKGFFFFLYVLSWNIYDKRIRDMLIRFKITIQRNCEYLLRSKIIPVYVGQSTSLNRIRFL